MQRILAVTFSVLTISVLFYAVTTHPNRDRADVLQKELDALEQQNDVLASKNEEMRTGLAAMNNDPRWVERQAREVTGLVKADERVYQFGDARPTESYAISIAVTPDKITVGGAPVKEAKLIEELRGIKERHRDASVEITYAEEVPKARKEHVNAMLKEVDSI